MDEVLDQWVFNVATCWVTYEGLSMRISLNQLYLACLDKFVGELDTSQADGEKQ